jgi:hypothetical protein
LGCRIRFPGNAVRVWLSRSRREGFADVFPKSVSIWYLRSGVNAGLAPVPLPNLDPENNWTESGTHSTHSCHQTPQKASLISSVSNKLQPHQNRGVHGSSQTLCSSPLLRQIWAFTLAIIGPVSFISPVAGQRHTPLSIKAIPRWRRSSKTHAALIFLPLPFLQWL